MYVERNSENMEDITDKCITYIQSNTEELVQVVNQHFEISRDFVNYPSPKGNGLLRA